LKDIEKTIPLLYAKGAMHQVLGSGLKKYLFRLEFRLDSIPKSRRCNKNGGLSPARMSVIF
jgi:hypothetical protein